ncbi:AAA family ATPase [Planktothrix agardhii]|jgi:AAA15 family ATPase/GTPase|uniref:AAA family ATPase n=1 Tax=Planktothrix agardhii TaxID=1160 RepID=UPI001F2587CA|nr:DUF3696 domain-containing protein [Planktothrix agardhii]MCF3646027.1 DUF3696 domain-containing protein [Planktothrix agardhii 1026]
MLTEYQLTNFKAFSKTKPIPIRPITLIYGPNSSGKSSIIQSLLLLKQTLQHAESPDIILIPKGNLVDLGSYRDFVYCHDVSQPFSIQATLPFHPQKWLEKSWALEQLQDTTELKIRINFAYDAEQSRIVFDSVLLFINHQTIPLISYKCLEEDPKFLVLDQFNLEHPLWQGWWKEAKNKIPKNFRHKVKSILEELGFNEAKRNNVAKNLAIVENKIQELEVEIKSILDKIEVAKSNPDNSLIFGLGQELSSTRYKLEEFSAIKFLSHRFNNYNITEGIEDLFLVQSYLFAVANRNFLPYSLYEEEKGNESFQLDYLSEVYSKLDSQDWISDLTKIIDPVFREWMEKIVYIGPLRDYPERFYIFSDYSGGQVGKEGSQVSNLLFNNPQLIEGINQQFKNFKLGYEVKIVNFIDEDDSTGSNLFAIRLYDEFTKVNVSILDVGFGISQVLPILVQCMFSYQKTILIEQPEVHIHPRLQTEIGSLFAECIKPPYENRFIIETHSEHLILRLQKLIRKGELKPDDIAVIYVDRSSEGSNCLELRLDEEGDFIDEWPHGFFEEDFKEIFEDYAL